jgi:hypothetical protein
MDAVYLTYQNPSPLQSQNQKSLTKQFIRTIHQASSSFIKRPAVPCMELGTGKSR